MEKIIYKGVPVVTTENLASELNVEANHLTVNFNRNKKFYKEGEDFFVIKGSELKDFLRVTNCNVQISSKTRSLYLWTESGSMNHVKSLQNDEAWGKFIILRNNYFRQREALQAIGEAITRQEQLLIHTKKEVQLAHSKAVNSFNFNSGGIEQTKEYNTESCLLHSGFNPKQVKNYWLVTENKERAKNNKKPIKSTPSAKEIFRIKKPEVAASMSITDYLVQNGGDLKECAQLSLATQPVFKKMIELGIKSLR